MNYRASLFILVLTLCAATHVHAQAAPDAALDREMSSLLAAYKSLHAAPELSHHEEQTAAFVAKELRALGYDVTERVGKYERPELVGYGVVAVMRNGAGATLLVRADMDGLPVEEKTGLPYASTVRTKNDAGQDVSVMHACGHDIHVTALVGTARLLAQLKDRWHGTLVLIGQPAEETIDGAQAMLNDNLYTRFPKPDFAIALHDNADLETGKVGIVPGYALASSSSVDIIVRGLGGHGAKPEATKDPVVLAAQIVLALQTIVSRENSPLDPAVVTVGSIHGGTKRNIIPDDVTLQLTIRTYKEDVRQHILAAIKRIAAGTAEAAGIPADHAPIVRVNETEFTPATYNDPALAERLTGAFNAALGAQNVVRMPPVMASEDFGRFALADHQIPAFIFWVGAVEPAKVAASKQTGTPLPSLHSALFAPVPEPTIRTAVKAMTAAVLELMKK